MTKWEYEKFDLNQLGRDESEIDVLNQAGRQGWELISISDLNIAIMKRPVEEAAPSTAAAPTPTTAAPVTVERRRSRSQQQ